MRRFRNWFQPKAQTWSKRTEVLLSVLAFAYLGSYSLEVLSTEPISAHAGSLISQAIWIIFVLDITIRLLGAKTLKGFLRSSWLEIFTLAVPFIRALRVFRVLMALRGLKVLAGDRLNATGLYIAMLVPFVWYTGALAVLDAEASSGTASITNLRDALWWSLLTITTLGYGELYPTTIEGQIVAAFLMLGGIALFSAAAGMFGSWIMRDKNTSPS